MLIWMLSSELGLFGLYEFDKICLPARSLGLTFFLPSAAMTFPSLLVYSLYTYMYICALPRGGMYRVLGKPLFSKMDEFSEKIRKGGVVISDLKNFITISFA